MNKFTKILILSIFTIFMIGGLSSKAFAVTAPLSVEFSSYPLFKEVSFVPGNKATSTIDVANNSGSSQNIIIESTNASDNDNLGDKLNIVITEGANILYDNKLGTFLRAGEISLSSLSDSLNTTYSLDITFDENADNDLQNKKLGFDLCIGFQGGETHCGSTVIAGENGSGGGGGSGSQMLIIWNEQANNIENIGVSGTTTITWNTNKLATSQVIYGPATGNYTLDLNSPNFGYPYSTTENTTKVTDHSMILTGLISGQTYVYRVVSRASPATVSYEHQFTIPQQPLTEDDNLALNNDINNGQVLGAETKKTTTGTDNDLNNIDNKKSTTNNNLLGASVLSSSFDSIMSVCSIYGLLILLLIYLLWKLLLRKKYEKKMVPGKEINDKFCLYFGGTSLAVIIILLFMDKYCPLWIFIVSFVLSISFYMYRKLKK